MQVICFNFNFTNLPFGTHISIYDLNQITIHILEEEIVSDLVENCPFLTLLGSKKVVLQTRSFDLPVHWATSPFSIGEELNIMWL